MTKRTNRLRRHYSRLTVFERVQLLLAAQERDDPLEIRTLDETCPGADLYLYIARMLALEHSACLLVVQLLAQALLLVTRHQALPNDATPTGPPDPDLVFLFERQAA